MILAIKLYGHLSCNNPNLPCYGQNKFTLEIPQGTTLRNIHELLELPYKNLVSIVDGHAQPLDYLIYSDCNISIFLPMSERKHNFFEKI